MSVLNSTSYLAPNGMIYNYAGTNKTCTLDVCPVYLSIYGYRPSLPVSIVLIVLYAICMVAQIILGVKHKTWGFMAAMLLGCIVEIIGYVGRILYFYNPWAKAGFIIQIVLITIGPVFFSAAIYVLLSRVCVYIEPKASRFPPVWFYWIFIPCDILSLVLQAAGGSLSATATNGSPSGVDIALAGLSLQVATLFFFVAFCIDYAIRSRRYWRHALSTKFKIFILFLSAATTLIWIRCCYRVYELSQGYTRTSVALRDQGIFIALESVMVIVAALCLITGHPGPVLSNEHIHEGPAGVGSKVNPEASGKANESA